MAFWGAFEVALRLVNLTSSNGVVARLDLYRDNMQVTALIRNTSMLELAL